MLWRVYRAWYNHWGISQPSYIIITHQLFLENYRTSRKLNIYNSFGNYCTDIHFQVCVPHSVLVPVSKLTTNWRENLEKNNHGSFGGTDWLERWREQSVPVLTKMCLGVAYRYSLIKQGPCYPCKTMAQACYCGWVEKDCGEGTQLN